ncbi:hypothetical protein C8Q77DRAFT_1071551 [Trametes polyzona]|nr:hypothetical protein C8Q77DRAFT_1071551 [Trametes polyzona]
MQLLDLPDDLLVLIFSHIHGRDALHAALASKRFTKLALPRVAAAIFCWKPSMLRRLHAYLLGGRAQYLRKLTIEVHTFAESEPDAARAEAGGEVLRGGLLAGAPHRGHAALASKASMSFWGRVQEAAPRLQVLEIRMSVPAPLVEYARWLDDLPDALRPLRVLCIRVYVPQLNYPLWAMFVPTRPELLSGHERLVRERLAEAREMEARRAAAMGTLRQRLADAIPALQILAILDEGPNEDISRSGETGGGDGGVQVQPSSGSGSGAAERGEELEEGDNLEAYEWVELRRTRWIRPYEWWRVVDGVEGRELESITVEEGERQQQQLIEGQESSMLQIAWEARPSNGKHVHWVTRKLHWH